LYGRYAPIKPAAEAEEKARPDILSVTICHAFYLLTLIYTLIKPRHIYIKASRYFFFQSDLSKDLKKKKFFLEDFWGKLKHFKKVNNQLSPREGKHANV